MSGSDGLGPFLNAQYGAEPLGSFIEVRFRLPAQRGMGQRFFGVRETVPLTNFILGAGERTDVYVGVAPRSRKQGTRDAVAAVHVLWVDVDDELSAQHLRQFAPRPSMVVGSGSPYGRHAYWALDDPIGADEAERANRRLAHCLGADSRATDAARILRPPGTFNHKYDPIAPVELLHLHVEVFTLAEVVGDLPDPPAASKPAPLGPRPRQPIDGDVFLAIEPREYVEVLTGRQVGADGKVCCPLPGHEDRTPSCQVYDDPERGWYCFGCARGGSIYDFAGALFGLETRGEDFKLLQRRISERFLNTPVAA